MAEKLKSDSTENSPSLKRKSGQKAAVFTSTAIRSRSQYSRMLWRLHRQEVAQRIAAQKQQLFGSLLFSHNENQRANLIRDRKKEQERRELKQASDELFQMKASDRRVRAGLDVEREIERAAEFRSSMLGNWRFRDKIKRERKGMKLDIRKEFDRDRGFASIRHKRNMEEFARDLESRSLEAEQNILLREYRRANDSISSFRATLSALQSS